jgi:uncharacterized protein (DUF697 family)/predicted GTPase
MMGWFQTRGLSDSEFERRRSELLAKAPVPVLWLLGKTGSGKSSVARAITGADAAIGSGYRPQTVVPTEYAFPNEETPLVRFLDTRGLGEAGVDDASLWHPFADRAHLVIVTVPVLDQALEPVLLPLRQLRERDPRRPVLLVLTTLHRAYPRQPHRPAVLEMNWLETPDSAGLPEALSRAVIAQKDRFQGLYDRVVAVDLTRSDEGFQPADLGLPQLKQALLDLLPAALQHSVFRVFEQHPQLKDQLEQQAWPMILGSSSLAATAGATPVPWIEIPVIGAIQTRLIWQLAKLYGQPQTRETLQPLLSLVGGRALLSLGLRAPLKLIPVLGLAVNAGLAFAATVALGKVTCWYFARRSSGLSPTAAELQAVWGEQLSLARQLWGQRSANHSNSGSETDSGAH